MSLTTGYAKPRNYSINWGHRLSHKLVAAYYAFEGVGSGLRDIVSEQHGTFNGDTTWKVGPWGKTIDVIGSAGAGINCGAFPVINAATQLSVFCRFRTDTTTGGDANRRDIIGKEDSTSPRSLFALRLNTSNNYIEYSLNNTTGWFTADTGVNSIVSTTTWFGVCGTWDAQRVRIYLDGHLKDTVALINGNLGTWTTSMWIGRQSNVDARRWDGQIDCILMWLRGLSGWDVVRITADPYCLIRPRVANLVPAMLTAAAPAYQPRHGVGMLSGVAII